jgi:F-type H+-transporting ATPase subunit gamma
MATLRDLRKRIAAVKNTKTITRAMQMVAAAKLRRAQAKAFGARPYSERIEDLVSNLLEEKDEDSQHPLIEEREEKNTGILIVTSDRGLCGAFNNNVNNKAEAFIKEKLNVGKEVTLFCVGKKARDFFTKRKYKIKEGYADVLEKDEAELSKRIGDSLIKLYIEKKIDKLYIFYSKFLSVIRCEIKKEEILPVFTAKSENKIDYIYEPNKKEILDEIIPKFLKIKIRGSFLESLASEYAARMVAMETATNNCDELITGLTLDYNKARQAGWGRRSP